MSISSYIDFLIPDLKLHDKRILDVRLVFRELLFSGEQTSYTIVVQLKDSIEDETFHILCRMIEDWAYRVLDIRKKNLSEMVSLTNVDSSRRSRLAIFPSKRKNAKAK